jgi:hypothetical protein
VTSFINGAAPAKIRSTSVTAESTTISSTVSGLTAGTAATLMVSATDAGGSDLASATSAALTSTSPATPGNREVAGDDGLHSLGVADFCGSEGGESWREHIVGIANVKGSS